MGLAATATAAAGIGMSRIPLPMTATSAEPEPDTIIPADEPAEYDVLVHGIESAKLEFWNWKNLEWQETWDTTQADGQKGWLPSRVRITVTIKDNDNKDYKLTTQARILMQEPLNFTQ